MRSIAIILFGAWLTAAGGGCISYATTYDGNPVTWKMAEYAKPGVTTKAEVLQELGAPREIRAFGVSSFAQALFAESPSKALTVHLDPTMRDEVYIYERSATTRFGLILGFFNYYTSDRRVDRLSVVFDAKHTVMAVGYTPGADASESELEQE